MERRDTESGPARNFSRHADMDHGRVQSEFQDFAHPPGSVGHREGHYLLPVLFTMHGEAVISPGRACSINRQRRIRTQAMAGGQQHAPGSAVTRVVRLAVASLLSGEFHPDRRRSGPQHCRASSFPSCHLPRQSHRPLPQPAPESSGDIIHQRTRWTILRIFSPNISFFSFGVQCAYAIQPNCGSGSRIGWSVPNRTRCAPT